LFNIEPQYIMSLVKIRRSANTAEDIENEEDDKDLRGIAEAGRAAQAPVLRERHQLRLLRIN
jgi:hypothetical protein